MTHSENQVVLEFMYLPAFQIVGLKLCATIVKTRYFLSNHTLITNLTHPYIFDILIINSCLIGPKVVSTGEKLCVISLDNYP